MPKLVKNRENIENEITSNTKEQKKSPNMYAYMYIYAGDLSNMTLMKIGLISKFISEQNAKRLRKPIPICRWL